MAERGVARLAPAKVNLALHVTGRRADGYHLLDSIAVFADVGDRVEIDPADALSLSVSGRFAAHAPGDATDLSFRAATAFFERCAGSPPPCGEGLGEGFLGRAAAIRLEKNIPAGAGLGGGSADAAAVLAGLNAMFGTPLTEDELKVLGLKLGADVPMCLVGHALRARGIGEDIRPLENWPPLPILLVWPGASVSTAAVFMSLQRRDNPPLADPPALRSPVDAAEWLQSCRNDLEAPALAIAPQIDAALRALRETGNCFLARMSGSGSGCFGLYPSRDDAVAAAARLGAKQPDWWIAATVAR